MIFVPPTAANIADWIRQAATVLNTASENVAGLIAGVKQIATNDGAPASPSPGQVYFDTSGTKKAYCWDGTTWQPLW